MSHSTSNTLSLNGTLSLDKTFTNGLLSLGKLLFPLLSATF
jgi:hypothetical protein